MRLHCGDAIEFMNSLPADSVDLCLFSPPYECQRSYGLGELMRGEEWVAWMIDVFRAARRVTTGLVCAVVEGRTKKYEYSATPFLLVADLKRAGFVVRKPPVFHRVGIPGSGGPDWWRNDCELCVCTTRGGKLPWSDNVATGHAPIYPPGGPPSHRTAATKGRYNGDLRTESVYLPPKKANPGNAIEAKYTATEVAAMLDEHGDWQHCNVGGGKMGSPLAHENEAPFPEALVEPFIRCFCPPNGTVLDPFCGSGTTCSVAIRLGRRAIGCDVRESQIELTRRRVEDEQVQRQESAEVPAAT